MVKAFHLYEEAGRLRALLKESGDDFSTNIAEFAMGSNPKARLTGNVQEEKIKLGTIHFALGNSLTLGGKVKSKTHLDCVVKNARVVIDGKPVLEDSKPITD